MKKDTVMNLWSRNLVLASVLIGGLTLSSCSFGPRTYDDLKIESLETGIIHDSLFLGMYFKMPRDDFYNYCYEKNREGVFTHGQGNMSVAYDLGDQLSHPATLNFYPRFNPREKWISGMNTSVHYKDWAPWLKDRFAQPLMDDFAPVLEEWFGKSMVKVTKDGKPFYYILDGNMELTMTPLDDQMVDISITDLSQQSL